MFKVLTSYMHVLSWREFLWFCFLFQKRKKGWQKRNRFKGLNAGKIAAKGQKDHCELQKSPRKGERGKKGTTCRSPLSIVSVRSAATHDRCPAHCPPSASSLPPGWNSKRRVLRAWECAPMHEHVSQSMLPWVRVEPCVSVRGGLWLCE